MATTTEHIAARNDADLLDRFVAAAEKAGIDNAAAWVQPRMGKLVRQQVGQQTVADVHARADVERSEHISSTPPRPGADLAAVTDTFLESAIAAVATEESSPAE